MIGSRYRCINLLSILVLLFTCRTTSAAVGAARGRIEFTKSGEFGDDSGPGEVLHALDLAVDTAGRVYILDYGEYSVKRYGPDGTFEMAIGRQGEGPGEFEKPRNLAVTPDGGLSVYDLVLGRFTAFDQDGVPTTSTRFQGGSRSLRTLPNGSIVGHFRFPDYDWVDKGMLHKILIFGDGFSNPTEVLSERLITHQLIAASDASTTNVLRPFAPDLLLAVLPSGEFVTATSNKYSLQWHDSSGTLLRRVAHDVRSQPVTGADRDRYVAEQSDSDEAFAAQLRSRIEFPSAKPPLRALQCGPRGQLLVELTYEAGPAAFDVFTSHGDYLGRVEGPDPASSVFYLGDTAYQVIDASDDSPARVIRYDVQIVWSQD